MKMENIVLWKDREKKIMDPLLFSRKAEEFARQTARENDTEKGNPNKRSQLRKFFDETVRLNMSAKANPDNWSNVVPLVHMLTAKAAYAQGRNLISKGFLDFIRNGVGQIERPEDLDVFATFFESFVGFYRLHGPKN
jgi:CRISPR-associated protein Csm2